MDFAMVRSQVSMQSDRGQIPAEFDAARHVGFPKALHFASRSLSRLLGHSHQRGLFEQSPLGKKADSSKPH